MGFDLKSTSTASASERGYTFEPRMPGSGVGIGASITVRGPHSAAARELLRRELADRQARELQAKRRGKEVEPLTLAALEATLLEQAVTFTMDWAGIEDAGQPVPFSADACRALYVAHPWIRDQVMEEARDLGNFIGTRSTSCSTTPAQPSTVT